MNMNENLQDRILIKLNDWWNTYAHLFRGWLQREVFRTNNPTKDADYIPNIEITNKYRKTNNGLLMIGCNPSGNDYAYYRDKGNKCDFCIYDKENQYTTAIYNFANNVNCADNYACIDLFPIVLGEEAQLKENFENDKNIQDALKALAQITFENIIEINPKVIAITDTFVRDLFTISFPKLGLLEVHEDTDNVCYDINIKDKEGIGHLYTIFCGAMLTGQRPMDRESRKRFEKDVRNYLNN